jgi:hypothetical protein
MMAVKLPFPLVFRSPLFNFILCPKFYSVPFLFGLTVPRQFIVLLCKSSNNVSDEKKLSTYNLCLTCSILAAHPVTVACVAVVEGVAHFPSLPKYTIIISIPSRITQLVVLYPRPLVFLWYILFEDDSTFEGHNDFINCKMFGWSVIFSIWICHSTQIRQHYHKTQTSL